MERLLALALLMALALPATGAAPPGTLGDLRAAFNAASDSVRLVALLAPT